MSNPTLTIHVGAPDPNWHPQTFTDACAFLDQLIAGNLDGPYIPYVISSITPAVENQDKLWFKLDGGGRPIGFYVYYGGTWRKAYSGLPNEVRIFSGDPAAAFDTNGRGIVGGDWDGWALMDGRNGTSDLSDRFVIAAHMNGASGVARWNGGWQTNVVPAFGPLHVGGAASQTLTLSNIPQEAKDALVVDQWKADGNARLDTGQLFGEHSDATADTGTAELVPAVPARAGSAVIPVYTTPPFFALAYCKFVGYL